MKSGGDKFARTQQSACGPSVPKQADGRTQTQSLLGSWDTATSAAAAKLPSLPNSESALHEAAMRGASATAAVLALVLSHCAASHHPHLQQHGHHKAQQARLRHQRPHREQRAPHGLGPQPAGAALGPSAQVPWGHSEPDATPVHDLTMSRLKLGMFTDGAASRTDGADSFASAVSFLAKARLSQDSAGGDLQPDGTLSSTDAASASRLHLASPEAYGTDRADQILADQATGAETGPSPKYEEMPIAMFTDARG